MERLPTMNGKGATMTNVIKDAAAAGCCVQAYVHIPTIMHIIPRTSKGRGTLSDPPSQV